MLCCCSADGNYEVTLMTKATVYCTGLVLWQPPAVYKSSCSIDVEFFPYDVQTCVLKLGSWTYDGFKVTMTIEYRLQVVAVHENIIINPAWFIGAMIVLILLAMATGTPVDILPPPLDPTPLTIFVREAA